MTTETPPIQDPRIASIQQALRAREARLMPTPDAPDDRTHAAVSLILRPVPDLELLLIKRAEVDGDPWSGHMALPGGRRDAMDGSLLETAQRETLEETALNLEADGTMLGRLRSLAPSTFRLPPISIFPYVFAVPADAEARVASREVNGVFWASLRALRDPAARSSTPIEIGSEVRDFPCLRVEGHAVWGLTYRILTDFLRVFSDPSTPA